MLSLENTKCKDTEEKPKNNSKVYGFVADFEVQILAVKDDKYFGISKMNESEGWVANGWKKDGTCLYDDVSHLKPIIKEWYENPDNFPSLVVDDNKKILYVNKYQYTKENNTHWVIYEKMGEEIYSLNLEYFRPATKEEVLALLVKE